MGKAKIELTRESIKPIIAQYNAGKFVDLLYVKSGGPSGPSEQASDLESLSSGVGTFRILSDSQLEDDDTSIVWGGLRNGESLGGFARRSGELGSGEFGKGGEAAVSVASHVVSTSSTVLRTGEEEWEGGEAYFSGSDYGDADVQISNSNSNSNAECPEDEHDSTHCRRANFGSAMEVLEELNSQTWLPPGPNHLDVHQGLHFGNDDDDDEDGALECSVRSRIGGVLTGPCDEGGRAECNMWSGGDAYFSNSEDEDSHSYPPIHPGLSDRKLCRQERRGDGRNGKDPSDNFHLILKWDGGDAYYSESDDDQ